MVIIEKTKCRITFQKSISFRKQVAIKKGVKHNFLNESHTVATISEILEGQKNITKKSQIVFLIITLPMKVGKNKDEKTLESEI